MKKTKNEKFFEFSNWFAFYKGSRNGILICLLIRLSLSMFTYEIMMDWQWITFLLGRSLNYREKIQVNHHYFDLMHMTLWSPVMISSLNQIIGSVGSQNLWWVPKRWQLSPKYLAIPPSDFKDMSTLIFTGKTGTQKW